VASLISFDESVVVYQSDSEFLEDEPLILDPPIDGTVYASVAKVHAPFRPASVLHPLTTTSAGKVIFQPIDELGDFQTSSVTMINVMRALELAGMCAHLWCAGVGHCGAVRGQHSHRIRRAV